MVREVVKTPLGWWKKVGGTLAGLWDDNNTVLDSRGKAMAVVAMAAPGEVLPKAVSTSTTEVPEVLVPGLDQTSAIMPMQVDTLESLSLPWLGVKS